MVELTTNRNSPWGAWVWDIHPDANAKTIDWKTFQEPVALKNRIPFGEEALKRFFRWRCWYDYGTGLSGDLLSHDYDTINQIMDIGIPKYASSTGGIYYYKDGRDVPDVWNATFEFPDKDLTVLYSATLSSNNPRGNRIMGHFVWRQHFTRTICRTDGATLRNLSGFNLLESAFRPARDNEPLRLEPHLNHQPMVRRMIAIVEPRCVQR